MNEYNNGHSGSLGLSGSIANAKQPEPSQPPEPAFVILAKKLEEQVDFARRNRDAITAQADHLFGAVPTASNSTGAQPLRCGLIGRIEDLLDELFCVNRETSAELHRLSGQA